MRDNSWIGGDNSFTGGGGGGIAPSNNLMRSRNSGIAPPAGRMNKKVNNPGPNPNSMAMQRSPNFNGGMNGGMMGGWGGAPSQGAIGNMLSNRIYPGGMNNGGGMNGQPPMGGAIGPDDQQLQQLLQMFLKRGDVRF